MLSKSRPVGTCLKLTDTPGSTPPLWSVTVPVTVAVVSWAVAGRSKNASKERQQHRLRHQRRIDILRTFKILHVYAFVTLKLHISSGNLLPANDLHWRDRRRSHASAPGHHQSVRGSGHSP